MCLTIDIKKHPNLKPIILNEDMKVYKAVKTFGTNVKAFYSPYKGFEYVPGFHYYQTDKLGRLKTSFKKDKFWNRTDIYEGLHSIYSIRYTDWLENLGTVVGMIIPKGSYVYFGDSYDIVSNQLIFPKDYDMYRVQSKRMNNGNFQHQLIKCYKP